MNPQNDPQEQEGFIPLLFALRAVKRPVSVAPTHVPKNLLEQFEIYESGATRRLYVYIGGWHYVTLT
jgi:hypothetical protein